MAHLWINDEAGWNAAKLASPLFDLGLMCALESAESIGDHVSGREAGAGIARLVQVDAAGGAVWSLIASPGFAVRVNGHAPSAGLRVLADRDEIRVGRSRRYFFSTESPAVVQSFPGTESAVLCSRCRQQIEKGASAVRCPGCGLWYDESAELPCWTYAPKCVRCNTRTALDAGFQWTPED